MATNIFTGFKIPDNTLAKVKYIAWHDRVTLTDMVVKHFENDIAEFEKKNGAITDEQLKKVAKKKG
jgi:pullulanase/glycogen debranching enzyme